MLQLRFNDLLERNGSAVVNKFLLHGVAFVRHLHIQDAVGPSYLVGSVLDVLEKVVEPFGLTLEGFVADLPDGRLVDLGVYALRVVEQS